MRPGRAVGELAAATTTSVPAMKTWWTPSAPPKIRPAPPGGRSGPRSVRDRPWWGRIRPGPPRHPSRHPAPVTDAVEAGRRVGEQLHRFYEGQERSLADRPGRAKWWRRRRNRSCPGGRRHRRRPRGLSGRATPRYPLRPGGVVLSRSGLEITVFRLSATTTPARTSQAAALFGGELPDGRPPAPRGRCFPRCDTRPIGDEPGRARRRVCARRSSSARVAGQRKQVQLLACPAAP